MAGTPDSVEHPLSGNAARDQGETGMAVEFVQLAKELDAVKASPPGLKSDIQDKQIEQLQKDMTSMQQDMNAIKTDMKAALTDMRMITEQHRTITEQHEKILHLVEKLTGGGGF